MAKALNGAFATAPSLTKIKNRQKYLTVKIL
jgi:hypothetical protein